MYKSALFFAFLITPFLAGAQEHAQEETTTLMRGDIVGGLHFNTRGWGIAASYGFQKNYKYKNTVGFTFSNIRHEKEQKIYPDIITNTKGYYYGKLNSLVSLRLTYGGKLVLFQSKRENGIEIAAKWEVGPSLGLLKPVYLKIDKLNITVDERYDPTLHNSGNINSRSSWFKGLGEARFMPGAFVKAGVDFNFSPVREVISGGEFGVIFDYFFTDSVQILYNNPDMNYFTGLYLQFNFGRRLY
ncbi:MAG: hypothetical protein HYZ14_00680 [Bacteroidetes bacterium]|nr:hypothetical protein [Bacteroidota bacterium]